jgi:hypothetical protein
VATVSLVSSAACVSSTAAAFASVASFISQADAIAIGIAYPYFLQLPPAGDDVTTIPWFDTPVSPVLVGP